MTFSRANCFLQLAFPLMSIGILNALKAEITVGWLYFATKCNAVSPCYMERQNHSSVKKIHNGFDQQLPV